MYDIIIIGAGVSGCACARELSRYDAKILVVEKEEDVCCGTSKANSAIVHAGYDAAHGSLMAKLNVEGSRRMPALAKELDFAYDRCGSLVVCLSDEDRPALQKLYENGIANGVEGLRIIERDELVGMEPNISDAAVAALWAPTGGIVCPFGLTFALAENAAKNGVQFRFDTKVTGLHPLDGGGTGWAVETDHGTLETRCIVNAAGVYARRIDDAACFQRAVVGLDGPPGSAAVQRVQARNFGVKPKLHTVFGGVLRQRKRQAERADDAARGRPQCGDGGVRDIRLHSHQLVPFYDAQPLHAVGDAVFIELLQRGAVLVAQADDKAAAPVVGKIQLLRKGRHPAAALDVELGHQAAVGRVVPGVDNGAVGLGRAAADVLLLLYHKNFRVIPRKLPRAGTPGHARADNDDVVHIDTSCCWFVRLEWLSPWGCARRRVSELNRRRRLLARRLKLSAAPPAD